MKYFFGIGINNYNYISSLNNAVKDVCDIVELLIDAYDFEASNTLILTDINATRSDIIENLERYRDIITPDDSLLIYYSGHGYLTKDKRGFWLPVDAERGKISSFIGNEIIQTYIRAINSKHTLLISDSCFSGSLLVRDERLMNDAMEDLDQRVSRWVFSSGRDDQKVSDGIKGNNSPFAAAILRELRSNTLPLLNIQKLGVNVLEITRSNSTQLPEICPMFDSGDQGGQFIFRLKSGTEAIAVPKGSVLDKPLDDELEWYLALKNNKVSDYEKYITSFSTGKFVQDALKRLLEVANVSNIPKTVEKRNLPNRRKSHSLNDLIFVFGRVNAGKSTIIASLFKFLTENISNKVLYDLANEGGRIVSYFNDVLSKTDFPSRTMIGAPTEIKLQVESEKLGYSIPLTILEMSGEELMQISPDRKNQLPAYIDAFLQRKLNYTFILVVEVHHENQEDFLTYSFINYILSLKKIHPHFILLISKWDLLRENITVEEYVPKNLPSTHSLLLNSRSDYLVEYFSIGQVIDYNSIMSIDKDAPDRLWRAFLRNRENELPLSMLKRFFGI